MKISSLTVVAFLVFGKTSLAILDKGGADSTSESQRRYLHGASLIKQVDKTKGFESVILKASMLFKDQKDDFKNDNSPAFPQHDRRSLSGGDDAMGKSGKKAGGKKSSGTQVAVEECRSKLEQCQAELDAPSWLFVQMANHCLLARSMASTGELKYTLSSHDMSEETWGFTDRPFQVESTFTTMEFFDTFDENFGVDSEGGSPNAAFTFVHEEDHVFNGPLVAVMIDASYVTTDEASREVTYMYALAQSLEQATTLNLDSFFEDGGDEVLFEDCSIFIDSADEGTNEIDYSYLTCQCENRDRYEGPCDDAGARFHCWWHTEPVTYQNWWGDTVLAIDTDDDHRFAGDFYCDTGSPNIRLVGEFLSCSKWEDSPPAWPYINCNGYDEATGHQYVTLSKNDYPDLSEHTAACIGAKDELTGQVVDRPPFFDLLCDKNIPSSPESQCNN
eukprot:CAMPEP_0172448340 /NCGR_PEP_ID=MMETSP1065-20121228/7374_1 /TAXON_ID=265537 /ORGANISM="Amphiprora paludosa, Strain CCMP125" /LENGTH=445 /DNA_ID=CAMNT_0013199803 /DNA_START=172 /DNA_END=1509 /DNA_ORIENTATION=-